MIVVLEIEITAPANRLGSQPQPNAWHIRAEPDHQAALHDSHEAGRGPHAQFAQAELDAQREHEQDHAQLGQVIDDVAVRFQGTGM